MYSYGNKMAAYKRTKSGWRYPKPVGRDLWLSNTSAILMFPVIFYVLGQINVLYFIITISNLLLTNLFLTYLCILVAGGYLYSRRGGVVDISLLRTEVSPLSGQVMRRVATVESGPLASRGTSVGRVGTKSSLPVIIVLLNIVWITWLKYIRKLNYLNILSNKFVVRGGGGRPL